MGEACDGRRAVTLAEQLSPSLVVMDIAMPQLNGIDAVRAVAAGRSFFSQAIAQTLAEDYVRQLPKKGFAGFQ